jgi:hypothetical protein
MVVNSDKRQMLNARIVYGALETGGFYGFWDRKVICLILEILREKIMKIADYLKNFSIQCG